MKKIYSAMNSIEAHFIQGVLQSHGIKSIVQGQHLETLQGLIPFGPSSACTVWIIDEQEESQALQIIQEHQSEKS